MSGDQKRSSGLPEAKREFGFVRARLGVFARTFFGAIGPARIAGAALLVLLSAATEGIGLALLVPLVALLGDPAGVTGGIARAANAAFAAIGIPLSLPALLAVFVVLIVFRALLLAWRDSVLARLEIDFVDGRRRDIYRAIAGASWQFLMRQRLSDLIETVTAQAGQIHRGTYFFLRVPAVGLLGAAQLAVAFALSPSLTLAALGWGALLLVGFHRCFGTGYREGERLVAARRAALAEISDFFHALKLAKSHGTEARHVAAFESALERQKLDTLRLNRSSVAMRLSIQIVAALTLGGFVYIAAEAAQLSTAGILVMVVIFARLTPLVAELQTGWQTVAQMLPAFDAAMDLLARCTAAAEPIPASSGRLELRREIVFDRVGFRYGDAGTPGALHGLDFTIPAGATVAIVGPTGAGKSTLGDLLLGLIAPSEGAIKVDGASLSGGLLARWRQSVGYVPQDNFFFNDTVRENLLWMEPTADETELARALDAASAADFVAALPRGLDTVIGERGVRLSGGERQRLGLARALLRKPTLLVLDEATSALDSVTERAVQTAIQRLHGSHTIVIIAHRLTTIRGADRIFVLENGKLAQSGTWNELARDRQGRFAALLDASETA